MGIFLILLLIAAIVFNFIKSRGKNRKVVFIANITMLSLWVGTAVWRLIDTSNMQRYFAEYGEQSVYSGGLFSGLEYEREDDEYYYAYHTGFLSAGEEMAIPKKNAEKARNVVKGSDIRLLTYGTELRYYEGRQVNGRYIISNSSVKIVWDPSNLTFRIIIYNAIALAVFNIIEFTIVLVMLLSGRKKPAVEEAASATSAETPEPAETPEASDSGNDNDKSDT